MERGCQGVEGGQRVGPNQRGEGRRLLGFPQMSSSGDLLDGERGHGNCTRWRKRSPHERLRSARKAPANASLPRALLNYLDATLSRCWWRSLGGCRRSRGGRGRECQRRGSVPVEMHLLFSAPNLPPISTRATPGQRSNCPGSGRWRSGSPPPSNQGRSGERGKIGMAYCAPSVALRRMCSTETPTDGCEPAACQYSTSACRLRWLCRDVGSHGGPAHRRNACFEDASASLPPTASRLHNNHRIATSSPLSLKYPKTPLLPRSRPLARKSSHC